jgi:hypothetical protein
MVAVASRSVCAHSLYLPKDDRAQVALAPGLTTLLRWLSARLLMTPWVGALCAPSPLVALCLPCVAALLHGIPIAMELLDDAFA